MFIQSHLLLAQAAARGLSAYKLKQLPLRPFLLGAVYPDLSIYYRKTPHNLRGALPIVRKLIHSIGIIRDSQEISAKQAFEMGIICHFLCDSFCQAHNFNEYQSFLSHNRYELQMDFLIHFTLMNSFFKMIPLEEIHSTSLQVITDIIQKAHDQYLQTPRALVTDMYFAVTCSSIVFENLFNIHSDIILDIA